MNMAETRVNAGTESVKDAEDSIANSASKSIQPQQVLLHLAQTVQRN